MVPTPWDDGVALKKKKKRYPRPRMKKWGKEEDVNQSVRGEGRGWNGTRNQKSVCKERRDEKRGSVVCSKRIQRTQGKEQWDFFPYVTCDKQKNLATVPNCRIQAITVSVRDIYQSAKKRIRISGPHASLIKLRISRK